MTNLLIVMAGGMVIYGIVTLVQSDLNKNKEEKHGLRETE